MSSATSSGRIRRPAGMRAPIRFAQSSGKPWKPVCIACSPAVWAQPRLMAKMRMPSRATFCAEDRVRMLSAALDAL